MVVTSLVEQPRVRGMDNPMLARDLTGTELQSFRGIRINVAVTNISVVLHMVVLYRSSMMLSALQLYLVRTTDFCEETNICTFPQLPGASVKTAEFGVYVQTWRPNQVM